jgi:hypothetical protein
MEGRVGYADDRSRTPLRRAAYRDGLRFVLILWAIALLLLRFTGVRARRIRGSGGLTAVTQTI